MKLIMQTREEFIVQGATGPNPEKKALELVEDGVRLAYVDSLAEAEEYVQREYAHAVPDATCITCWEDE